MKTSYVALLRGINVAGANKIGMADLRQLFTGLGHQQARTYLQSGNVVFGSGEDPAILAAGIETAIAAELGLTVTVLLRSGGELADVLACNPYLGREDNPARLPVTFLARLPEPGRDAGLLIPPGETAVLSRVGQEVYLHCPDGYGRTKLSNAYIERKLGVAATTRNWKSVTALHALVAG